MTKTACITARDNAETATTELLKLGGSMETKLDELRQAMLAAHAEADAKLRELEESKQRFEAEVGAKRKFLEKEGQKDKDDRNKQLEKKMRLFKEEMKTEREAYQKDVDSLEKEKALMNTLGEGSRDLVLLNVGGQIFTAKRSTLCHFEGSMLASMFSGRWEQSLDRDKEGRVYLDYNPEHFKVILNHLRYVAFNLRGPNISNECIPKPLEPFWGLVSYLGLKFMSQQCEHKLIAKGGQAHKDFGENGYCYNVVRADRDIYIYSTLKKGLKRNRDREDREVKCSGGCGYTTTAFNTDRSDTIHMQCGDCHAKGCTQFIWKKATS